jgi:hypothetical protein
VKNNTWERTANGQTLSYPTGRGYVAETEVGVRAFVATDDANTVGQRLFEADKLEQANG